MRKSSSAGAYTDTALDQMGPSFGARAKPRPYTGVLKLLRMAPLALTPGVNLNLGTIGRLE